MKEENIRENVKEVFATYLKKHQYRKTPERFAILDYIYSKEGHFHFDAEMLFAAMQDNYRVSLATIYNTLDLLEDINLIVKHKFSGQAAHYEKTFGSIAHSHLVCTQCGKVKEFTDKKIRTAIQAKSFSSFDVTHYSVYLYGVCKACRKKIEEQEK